MIALIPIQAAIAAITGVKAAAEISAASALTLGLGIATVIAGIVLGIGVMNSMGGKADDGYFEGGGYGKRTLLDKGQITRFNDADTIIAGTNLGGKADDQVNIPEGTINSNPQPPAPIILQNEVVYDSYQSANYYNGPRSTEKSETGVHA